MCEIEEKRPNGHDGQVKIKVGKLYNEICEPFGTVAENNSEAT